MALGTITNVSTDGQHGAGVYPIVLGDQKVTVTTVVGAASYTTGGDALTPANLGLSGVNFAICSVAGSASNNTASVAQYDIANQKLKMFSHTDAAGCPLAETASTTNVSGLTATVIAFGY